MQEITSPPTQPQATDKLAAGETRHGAAVPKSAAPDETGGGGRGPAGWTGPQGHTGGEQTTARTGTPCSEGQMETCRAWCCWNKQAPKSSAGTCPDFSNSCRSSLKPCFVPAFCSSKGPLCYLNLMVSMAFAQCLLMVQCKESGS